MVSWANKVKLQKRTGEALRSTSLLSPIGGTEILTMGYPPTCYYKDGHIASVDMHTAYRAFLNLKRLRKCNEASYRETQRARIKNRMKDAGRKLKIADNHPDLVAAMAAYDAIKF